MKIECDHIVFSTGKRVYANRDIIGFNPPSDDLSKPEKIEIADYMIGLWSTYKLDVGPPSGVPEFRLGDLY